jgi:hypothetical protein
MMAILAETCSEIVVLHVRLWIIDASVQFYMSEDVWPVKLPLAGSKCPLLGTRKWTQTFTNPQ